MAQSAGVHRSSTNYLNDQHVETPGFSSLKLGFSRWSEDFSYFSILLFSSLIFCTHRNV